MFNYKALSLIVLMVLVTGMTWAQTPTATLSGVVQDASGAIVPSAQIRVRNSDTGAARETATN